MSLPEATEGSHHGIVDFRLRGKIFATLGNPDPSFAMVALTPDEQALFVEAEPTTFVPVLGGWGRRGSTRVRLKAADDATVRSALTAAWRRIAPKTLLAAQTEAANDAEASLAKRSVAKRPRSRF
ncbi:MAG: MmcQ/YjbR family DNA-binding protein [Variibacter sp.]